MPNRDPFPTIRALANGNFLRLWLARGLSNVADTFYLIAIMWLVKEAGTPMASGLAGTLLNIPPILSLIAGVVVEKRDPRRVMVWALAANLVVIGLVSLGLLNNVLNTWAVLVAIFVSALIVQFVYPACHKLVPKLIEPEMLVSANSLLAFVTQTTEVLANACGGLLAVSIGPALLAALDVPIFAVAIILLLGIRVRPQAFDSAPEVEQPLDNYEGLTKLKRFWADLREGVSFVFRHDVLRTFVVAAAASNLAWGSFTAMLPWWISGTGGTAAHYGLFNAEMATGAVIGSLLAPLLAGKPAGRVFAACLILDLACFAFFPMAGLLGGGVLIFLFGLLNPVVNVIVTSGLQYLTPDHFRARVYSAFTSFGSVFLPVGSLFAGILGTFIPPSGVLLSTGLLALIAVLPFTSSPQFRSFDLPHEQTGQTG